MEAKHSRITRWLVRGIVGTVLLAVVGGVICVCLAISSSVHAEKTLHAVNFVTIVVDRFVQQEHRWPKSWDELRTVEATGVGSMYSWPADVDILRQFVTISFDADMGVIASQTVDDFDAIRPIGSYYPYKDYGHVKTLIETVKHSISGQQDAEESETVDDDAHSDVFEEAMLSLTQGAKKLYVECEPKDAETTLVVELTITDVITSQSFTFPLRRETSPLEHRSRRALMFNADGEGTYCGGSVSFRNGTESGVSIRVSCYWKALDLSRGQIEREVLIPVGATTQQQLSDKVSVKAHFQTLSQEMQGQTN